MHHTIFALATPYGRSGVAIIRVSGPQSTHSLEILTGRYNFASRQALYLKLSQPVSRETIDHALVLYFQSPASYTGEDVVEYHVHGSQAVIHALLDTLGDQPNHRLAEPGEFTRRAFENGKMDLTQAEAVADLIDAQTVLQKNQALGQLDGALSDMYSDWREKLTKALAYLEADLEFPDEDDADGVSREVLPVLEKLKDDIHHHLQDNRHGELIREGLKIAIVGAPNAGKSSLINALAKRDIAIVSDIPGTTRDVIEVHMDLAGYPVTLYDTAGLRDDLHADPQSKIEAEGIKRAVQKAESADLKILLYDGLKQNPDPYTLSMIDESSVAVVSKADQDIVFEYPAPSIQISSKTGVGIESLIDALSEKIESLLGSDSRDIPSLTRKRHRQNLQECLDSITRSFQADLPELMAEDVRLSIRALGRITGKVDVEDLLDIIFGDFCIGK